MKLPHLLSFVLIHFVWALAVILAKIGMDEIPPMMFTGLRFFLVSILLLPFLDFLRGRMALVLAVALTAGGPNFALYFTGLHLAEDVSALVVVGQLGVPFSVVMSILFLKEEVRWRRWLGILLSVGGVLFITFDPRVFSYVNAVLFGVAGALIGSVSMIFMRQLKEVQPFELQAWIAIIAWPILFSASFAFESGQFAAIETASLKAWAALVFAALFSSLIAHAGWYWLIQRYEVSQLSGLSILGPVMTIVMGVMLLGDTITLRMMIGGAIALLGVLIISIRQPEVSGLKPAEGTLPMGGPPDETPAHDSNDQKTLAQLQRPAAG